MVYFSAHHPKHELLRLRRAREPLGGQLVGHGTETPLRSFGLLAIVGDVRHGQRSNQWEHTPLSAARHRTIGLPMGKPIAIFSGFQFQFADLR